MGKLPKVNGWEIERIDSERGWALYKTFGGKRNEHVIEIFIPDDALKAINEYLQITKKGETPLKDLIGE